MELPKVEIDKETQKWKTALVVYEIGASPTIASLERFIATKWSFTAKPKIHIMMMGILSSNALISKIEMKSYVLDLKCPMLAYCYQNVDFQF